MKVIARLASAALVVAAASAASGQDIEPAACDLIVAEAGPGLDIAPCCCDCGCPTARWYDELTLFAGLDGSKQPQDFGVNANLGAQVHFNLGVALSEEYGIGAQVGHGIVATDNAVQVFEAIGESVSRTQHYTTVGLFQRIGDGYAWGFAYDWLNQDSYDDFHLNQWRVRLAKDLTCRDQLAVEGYLTGGADTGQFLTIPVRLEPIDQIRFNWRHRWESGVQTSWWGGVAEGHGEVNVALGDRPRFGESFLMGADLVAPLNNYLAIYGETNLIFPSDTGTVDAFLGLQFYPGGKARLARQGRFSPLLPVASPTSFSTDLSR